MYSVFNESQQLSGTTANKIQAIQIAREWIEAMKNIRETNWVLFSSDTANCWNNLSDTSECVGKDPEIYVNSDIQHNASYKIYQNPSTNRWTLIEKSWAVTQTLYSEPEYRWEFEVFYDSDWFYTQSWTLNDINKPLKPIFTREIKITYLNDWEWTNHLGTTPARPSNEEKMEVTSLVQWSDSSSTKPHKVEFTTVLSNWKK